jgi:hypothetical protein
MNEWTEVAAYRFIEQAMQVFPGSREEGTLSEGEVPGYLARNGYPALEAWPLCHGSKRDGSKCTSKRRDGSWFCGVHGANR